MLGNHHYPGLLFSWGARVRRVSEILRANGNTWREGDVRETIAPFRASRTSSNGRLEFDFRCSFTVSKLRDNFTQSSKIFFGPSTPMLKIHRRGEHNIDLLVFFLNFT